ncbi:hypothetical protein [Nostoc sp.]|uniref:hypothetical protein n=1 Tax=Nostoc sp. TaxID=1180 RepID=UPI002FF98F71
MLKVVILQLTLLCLDYFRLSDFWQMNLQLSARLLLVLLAVLEQSAITNWLWVLHQLGAIHTIP